VYPRGVQGAIWARSEQLRFVIEAYLRATARTIKNANGAKLLTKREEELAQLVAEASPTATFPSAQSDRAHGP